MTESCREGFKLEALRRLFDFKGRRRLACDAAAAALAAESSSKGVVGRLLAVAQTWGVLPRVGEPLGPHHAAMSATIVLSFFWAFKVAVEAIVAYLAHRRARNRMAEVAVAAAAAQAEEDAAWERRLQHQLPASMRKQAEAMVAQLQAVEREAFAVIRAKEERIVALAAGVTAAQAAAQAQMTNTSVDGDDDAAPDSDPTEINNDEPSDAFETVSGSTTVKASVLSAEMQGNERMKTPENIRSARLWQLPDAEGRPTSPIIAIDPPMQSSSSESSNESGAARAKDTSTPPKAELGVAMSLSTLPCSAPHASTDASLPVAASPVRTLTRFESGDVQISSVPTVATAADHTALIEPSTDFVEPANGTKESSAEPTTTMTAGGKVSGTETEVLVTETEASATEIATAQAFAQTSETSAAADAAATAASIAREQALQATRAAQAEAAQLTAQLNVLRSARNAAHAAVKALSLELSIGPTDDGAEGDKADGEREGSDESIDDGIIESTGEGDMPVNKPEGANEDAEPDTILYPFKESKLDVQDVTPASNQRNESNTLLTTSDRAATSTPVPVPALQSVATPPVLQLPLPAVPPVPHVAPKEAPHSSKSLGSLRAPPRRTQSEIPRGSVHSVPETPQSFGQRIKALFGKSVDLPVEPLVSRLTDDSVGQVSALEARLTALEMDSAQASAKEAAAAEYRRVLSAAEVFRSELAAELGRGYASSREDSDNDYASENGVGNDDFSVDTSHNNVDGTNLEDNYDEDKDDEADISGEDYDLGAAALHEALLLLGLPSSRDNSLSRASTPLSQQGIPDNKHSSASSSSSRSVVSPAHSRTVPRSTFRSLDANQAASTAPSSTKTAENSASSSVLWRPIARGRRSSSADKAPPPPSPPLPSPSRQPGPHVVRSSTPRPASSSVDRPPIASPPTQHKHPPVTSAPTAAAPRLPSSQGIVSAHNGAAHAPPARNNYRFESGNKPLLEAPGKKTTPETSISMQNENPGDSKTLPTEGQKDSDNDSNDLFNVLGLNDMDDDSKSNDFTVDNIDARNPSTNTGVINNLDDGDEEDEDDARFARLAASAAFFNNEVAAAARGFSNARSDSIASIHSHASSTERSTGSVGGCSPYSPSTLSGDESTRSNNDGRDKSNSSISPIVLRGLNSADASTVTSPRTPLPPSPDDELVSEKRPSPAVLARASSNGVDKTRGNGWARRFSLSALRWTNSGQA